MKYNKCPPMLLVNHKRFLEYGYQYFSCTKYKSITERTLALQKYSFSLFV